MTAASGPAGLAAPGEMAAPGGLAGPAGRAGRGERAGPAAAHGTDPLREVLRRFATGVTIVASGSQAPEGMTANAFTSVSLTPPLVLVCVKQSAAIHRTVLESGQFAVSFLAASQEHVARHFADHSRPRGRTEFDIVGWSPGPSTGAPVIHGALGWLECALVETYEGGDHTIFLGSVLGCSHGPASDALLFFGGGFHSPALCRADNQ